MNKKHKFTYEFLNSQEINKLIGDKYNGNIIYGFRCYDYGNYFTTFILLKNLNSKGDTWFGYDGNELMILPAPVYIHLRFFQNLLESGYEETISAIRNNNGFFKPQWKAKDGWHLRPRHLVD